MGDTRLSFRGIEPAVWFLLFDTTARNRWLSWLAMGRFKHVCALGYVPAVDAWVLYDVALGRTHVALMPDCAAVWEQIARARETAVTLSIAPQGERSLFTRGAFWCSTAMSHLIGVRTCFRPDSLYRECLRRGAVPLCVENPRPVADSPAHGRKQSFQRLLGAAARDHRVESATG